jgi:hypothetical protein
VAELFVSRRKRHFGGWGGEEGGGSTVSFVDAEIVVGMSIVRISVTQEYNECKPERYWNCSTI